VAIMTKRPQDQRMTGKKSASKSAEDRNDWPPFFIRTV